MRTDWPAEYEVHWTSLARKYKVRLPQKATALSTGGLTRWLKAIDLSVAQFKVWTGFGLKDYVAANSTWSMRATAGLCLERVAEGRTQACQEQIPA